MKRILLIAGLLAAAVWWLNRSSGTENAFGPTDRTAIQTVLDSQLAHWNRGDIPGFMEGYWKSDSMYFITSKGFRAGHRATLEAYQKSYPDRAAMGTLRFNIHRIAPLDSHGELSIVHGDWEIGGSQKANKGPFSLIFKRLPEGWRIITDHTW
jgi:ketosteroid isomerase-like protein